MGGGTIYYTTNDGNIVNVDNYWKNTEYWPIENTYNKSKNRGVMKFKGILDKIPGVIDHPFLNNQYNLLTLKLPYTITEIGRGAFWECRNLEYINLNDLVNLENIERDWNSGTKLTKIDLRNTKLTTLNERIFYQTYNYRYHDYDYILLPEILKNVDIQAFSLWNSKGSIIKTLMIPTLAYPDGNFYIEDQITENLIINKFEGLGDLHHFNGDVKIWVPDEFYDGYVEKYTNYVPDKYLSKENCEDIVRRLRKYSDGVPEF